MKLLTNRLTLIGLRVGFHTRTLLIRPSLHRQQCPAYVVSLGGVLRWEVSGRTAAVLWVSTGFHLAFLYKNPISFRQKLTPVSIRLIFLCFIVHFLFSRYIALNFLFFFSGLSKSTRMFSFFNHPISFIFTINFRHTWQGITNVFLLTILQITVVYWLSTRPKWCTGRKWHIPMAVMKRNFVGGLGWQYGTR